MQTLQPRENSLHTVCMQTVQTLNKSAECSYCRLFEKKYASILHKVCTECTYSAESLQAKGRFVWEQPPFGENADLMHTKCRAVQNYCRHDAD